ncbi:MAG: NosD domain-containing protein [Candidatus Bathyarchaeia archaeon]
MGKRPFADEVFASMLDREIFYNSTLVSLINNFKKMSSWILNFKTMKDLNEKKFAVTITFILALSSFPRFAPEIKVNPSIFQSYIKHNPIYISGNDGFTFFNGVTSGSGTISDPYTISGWEIEVLTGLNERPGIVVENTNAFFAIKNCYIHGDYDRSVYYDWGTLHPGIILKNVINGKIESVKISRAAPGLQISRSMNNLFVDCNVYDNRYGVKILESEKNMIINSVIADNDGYSVSLENSSGNVISRSKIINGYSSNIILERHSNNNLITDCTISHGGGHGVAFENSNFNNVTFNVISIHYAGISLDVLPEDRVNPSSYNRFHHNNFLDNTKQVWIYDANFIGLNYWDDGAEGNYWNDHTGIDENNDGIGDAPYTIGKKNQDNHPLMNPWSGPVLSQMPIFETKFYQEREVFRWFWESFVAKLTPGEKTSLQIEFANPASSHAYIYISEDNLKSIILSDGTNIIDKTNGNGIKCFVRCYSQSYFTNAVEKIEELVDTFEAISTILSGDIPYEYLLGKIDGVVLKGYPTAPIEFVAKVADDITEQANLLAGTLFDYSIALEYGNRKGVILPPSSSIVFNIDVSAPQTVMETGITLKFDFQYVKTPFSEHDNDLPYMFQEIYRRALEGDRPLSERTTFSQPSRASATLHLKVEKPWWQQILRFVGGSPINIRVIDPMGREVGFDPVTNSSIIDIPEAAYNRPFSQPQIITIHNPKTGVYKVYVYGHGSGQYNLGIDIQNPLGQLISSIEKTAEIKQGEIQEVSIRVESTGTIDEVSAPWWIEHQLWIIGGTMVAILVSTISVLYMSRRKGNKNQTMSPKNLK